MVLLVWDIETVGRSEAMAYPTSASDGRPVDAFLKLPHHSIICIGALAAFRTEAGWEVDALAARTVAGQSEKQPIRSFVDFVGVHQPQMVTFNGHSFDLPVLRYRSMVHGLSAPGLHARPYYHRFTEDHVDICDVLSSFTYSGKARLDEISRVMELPGKPDGMDGSRVQVYYDARRIGEIANYCLSDILNTYRIWLRYELFRGRLTQEEFEFSDGAAARRSSAI